MELEAKDALLVAAAPLIRLIVEGIKATGVRSALAQPLAILISAVFFFGYLVLPEAVQVLAVGSLTLAGAASVYHDVRKPFVQKFDE